MPVVPGTPNLPGLTPSNPLGQAEAQPQPSNTNMMMAMAEMNRLGRFKQKAQGGARSHPASSASPLSNRPLPTNRTLRKLSPLRMNPTQR